ncbi:MAG: amidohydrolase family protein [Dehalococcoidia bacterium]|nr:amidohydrolase family protein [Dehalococcoidia bacterium]
MEGKPFLHISILYHMMVIDFHTHLFSDAVASDRQHYLDADPAFRSVYSNPESRITTADQLVEAMDRAGINRSVVCGFGWETPGFCERENDAIIEAVQRHPDRLVGLGTVSGDRNPDSTAKEIRRIRDAGLLGLGELRPDALGWLDDPIYGFDRIATQLRENQMILLMHTSEPVGHAYPGKERATPERLAPLLKHLSGVPTILAHAGGGLPFYAYMPEVADALTDVYVDTAALPYLYHPSVLDALVAAHGPDRLLFGTDFPLMEPERVLRYVDESNLNADDKARLLGGNAAALLALIAPAR